MIPIHPTRKIHTSSTKAPEVYLITSVQSPKLYLNQVQVWMRHLKCSALSTDPLDRDLWNEREKLSGPHLLNIQWLVRKMMSLTRWKIGGARVC